MRIFPTRIYPSAVSITFCTVIAFSAGGVAVLLFAAGDAAASVGLVSGEGETSTTGITVILGGAGTKRREISQFSGTVFGKVLKIQGMTSVASFTLAGTG